MVTFDLADLVMLQLVGGLHEFEEALATGKGIPQIIGNTKKQTSTPDLFPGIVRKTIEAQVANPWTVVRELGQNARDAYFEGEKRIVEFTTIPKGDSLEVRVRDYGRGMTTRELVHNLLIPYNSSKENDPGMIGEHGIGWFSVLNLSSIVEVTTASSDGQMTQARVEKLGDNYQAQVDVSEQKFKGTEVIFYVPTWSKNEMKDKGLNDIFIFGAVALNLGRIDPQSADILLNGKKVNTLAEGYNLGGTGEVILGSEKGDLRLFWKKNKYRKEEYPVTQAGFFIGSSLVGRSSLYAHNSALGQVFDGMRYLGFEFWVDLPTNIGLTKGRNSIIAQDKEATDAAFRMAFEEMLLNSILENEDLMYDLDSSLSDLVIKLLTGEREKSKKRLTDYVTSVVKEWNELLLCPVKGISTLLDLNYIRFTKGKNNSSDYRAESDNNTDNSSDRKEAQRKLAGQLGFADALLKKKCISATIKEGDGESRQEKVSIEDIINAYNKKRLHIPELGNLDLLKEEGLYVSSDNGIVLNIVSALDGKKEYEAYRKERMLEPLKAVIADNVNTLLSFMYQKRRQSPRISYFNPTSRVEFERIVKKCGMGSEYVTLIDIATHIDSLISKATGLEASPLALHKEKFFEVNVIDIAHTNQYGISLNLETWEVARWVADISRGRISEENLDFMIDTMIHEKAHGVIEDWRTEKEHGKRFYDAKRSLRDRTIAYARQHQIDLLEEINEGLSAVPEEKRLGIQELPKLVYSVKGSGSTIIRYAGQKVFRRG